MREFIVEVYGRKVLRAKIPEEIISDLMDMGWELHSDGTLKVLKAPPDVHNWIRGEVMIRELSELIIPDLEIKTEEGIIELYLEEMEEEESLGRKVIDFQQYRLQKNAMEILEALENLETLLHEKAQLVMQEEQLLEEMKDMGYEREEIEKYRAKVEEHKRSLERDFERLADNYPRLREKANLITLKNLLAYLDELEASDPVEYAEVKEALREAVLEHFSREERAS